MSVRHTESSNVGELHVNSSGLSSNVEATYRQFIVEFICWRGTYKQFMVEFKCWCYIQTV